MQTGSLPTKNDEGRGAIPSGAGSYAARKESLIRLQARRTVSDTAGYGI
jgi:hypothetical protein